MDKTIEELEQELAQAKALKETASRSYWASFKPAMQFKASLANYHDVVTHRGEPVTRFIQVVARVDPAAKTEYDRALKLYGHGPGNMDWDWRGATYAVVDNQVVGHLGGGTIWLNNIQTCWGMSDTRAKQALRANRNWARIQHVEKWLADNPYKGPYILEWTEEQ